MIGLRPDEAAREERIQRRRRGRAKAAAFRKAIGCSLRRVPGPLPSDERKTFARIVATSELSPRELLDELFFALCDQLQPSAPEAASWLARPEREAHGAIIQSDDPGATPIARGPAGNSGGSQR